MQYLAKTAGRGVKVLCNEDTLADTLSAGGGTMTLTTGTMFANTNVVTVQDEDVLITAGGGTASATVTRAQNDTLDSTHISGALVRAANGDTLLTHTFDGVEYFNAVRFGGEIEAVFGVYENDVLIYTVYTTPFKIEELIPFYRYQPAAGTVWKIEVWTTASESMFWAVFQ
jgi:hypothetical protein